MPTFRRGRGPVGNAFGLVGMRGTALCRELAEEAQGIRLAATFLVPSGERQRASARACASSRRPARHAPPPERGYRPLAGRPLPVPWSVPAPA